jgi:repressor LexA
MTQQRRTKKKPLMSATDERVLDFIRSFQISEGVAPTRQEIASGLTLGSLMSAQRAVQRLKDAGHLEFGSQSKRAIRVTEPTEPRSSVIELPMLGSVAAGRPIEAIESTERLAIPASMIRGATPHFVLKVKGDSMIEDQICDGDFVIVRQQDTANNGDKVVALIDNEATLKTFYRKSGRVELHPANSTLKPILVEAHQHLRIAGVYVGLIRLQN